MWLTNGGSSNLVAVLVKTDEGADSVYRNLTTFLVEKETGFGETAQGVTIPGKIDKMGYKGVDTTEMVFEGHRISADQILGGEPGKGFYQMMDGVEVGRVNVAARATGVANRAFELAIAYAQQRETFGKKIAEHQAILFRLAEMATKVETSHAMLVRAARMKDSGERNDVESGMAKYLAAEYCNEVVAGLVPDPRRLRVLQGVRDRAPLPRGGVPADRRGHRRHPEDDHRPGVAEGLQAQGLMSVFGHRWSSLSRPPHARWPRCSRQRARWSSLSRPRHRVPETLEILSPDCPECPVFQDRNCRWPMPEFPVWQRHSTTPGAPGDVHDRRRLPLLRRGRRPRAVDAGADRDRRQPDRGGRSCGTRSPSSSSATPTTPTASTSAPRPVPQTPAATGPTRPGRPNGTPSAAWTSRTPWTTTTSRSGTRWPRGRCPRSRRW